jgi:hypothetical protein
MKWDTQDGKTKKKTWSRYDARMTCDNEGEEWWRERCGGCKKVGEGGGL